MSNSAPNPRAVIGANNPPSSIESARETFKSLSDWLKDNPVVSTEDEARAGKLALDRAKVSIESMETERDALVRPLNTKVREINDLYRQPRTILEKVRDTIAGRLSAYALRLEQERLAAAEAARKAAEEAERIAREAEAREKEAAETAAAGVCDVDIAAVTEEADTAFSQFQRASRFAQRADRDTKVRLGGGLGKVSTLRSKETLAVTDWKSAIDALTDDDGEIPEVIAEAILTAARAYRKAYDRLPTGISQSFERSI